MTNSSIWNFASSHSLVIVTANIPADPGQRIDIEIIDGSERGNVYLSKRVSVNIPSIIKLIAWIFLGYQGRDKVGGDDT